MSRQINLHRFINSPDRMALLASFLTVGEKLSFVEAAHVLKITSPSVSRKVMQLEGELGVRLFNRSTRRVALTEAGRLYYDHCRRIVEQLEEADEMIAVLNSEPRGALRVSLPVAFGRRHVAPILFDFLEKNPHITMDTSFSDEFVDVISGGYDAVIRIGNLPDSTLRARLIAPNRRIVVASPNYIGRFGQPMQPAELRDHNCIRYNRYSSAGNIWQLQHYDEFVDIPIGGTFRTDDSEAVHEATLSGRGIGLVATYICYESLRRGDLVDLLPGWTSAPATGIYVAYAATTYLPPKVRAFIDYLTLCFRNPSWENPLAEAET